MTVWLEPLIASQPSAVQTSSSSQSSGSALSEEIFERLAEGRGKHDEPQWMWRALPEYGFPAASRFPITRSGESKIPDPFEGFERPVFGK